MPLIAMPGITELLLIFGALLLLFGGKKLPQLGGAVGESIRNFKKGIKDSDKEVTDGGDAKTTGKAANDQAGSKSQSTSDSSSSSHSSH